MNLIEFNLQSEQIHLRVEANVCIYFKVFISSYLPDLSEAKVHSLCFVVLGHLTLLGLKTEFVKLDP